MSALPPKADIPQCCLDVRFVPQADMQCSQRQRQYCEFCQQLAPETCEKIVAAGGSHSDARHRSLDAIEQTTVARKDGGNADTCSNTHTGTKAMTKTKLSRRVLLTSKQKANAAELRTMGFTRSQAWRRVLTPEQRQIFYEQIRTAERLRYIENPHREIICPVLPWIELHYPGHYRHDPAGASLDRIDREKGYVPGNVRVISLRANLLRKDITYKELRALADFFVT
jgi:hypothetical protein